MKASAIIHFLSFLSARQARYKAYRPESPLKRESQPNIDVSTFVAESRGLGLYQAIKDFSSRKKTFEVA